MRVTLQRLESERVPHAQSSQQFATKQRLGYLGHFYIYSSQRKCIERSPGQAESPGVDCADAK